MFRINNANADGIQYVIPLDQLDLALLPLWISKKDFSEETIPLWGPNNFLRDNQTYVEFEVHAQNNVDNEGRANSLNLEPTGEVEGRNVNVKVSEDEEIELDSYVKIVTTLNESRPTHTLKAVNKDLLEIKTVNGWIVQVSPDHFHGYVNVGDSIQCRLCGQQVGLKAVHKLTRTHLRMVMLPLADANCCRKIGDTLSHCVLCNELIENVQLHSQIKEHQTRLAEALKASLEQKSTKTNEVQIKDKFASSNANREKDQNKIRKHNQKPVNYYCRTCNLYVNRNTHKHNNSDWHKSKLHENVPNVHRTKKDKNTTLFNNVAHKTGPITRQTQISSSYNDNEVVFASLEENEAFCSICNRKMHKGNIETHLQGKYHKQMADAKAVNVVDKIILGKRTTDTELDEARHRVNLSKITEENKISESKKAVATNKNIITEGNNNNGYKKTVAAIISNTTEGNKVHDRNKPLSPQSNISASVPFKSELIAHTSTIPDFRSDGRNHEQATLKIILPNSAKRGVSTDTKNKVADNGNEVDGSVTRNTPQVNIHTEDFGDIMSEGKCLTNRDVVRNETELDEAAPLMSQTRVSDTQENETRCEDCCICF